MLALAAQRLELGGQLGRRNCGEPLPDSTAPT
jgi:hypothetical protein